MPERDNTRDSTSWEASRLDHYDFDEPMILLDEYIGRGLVEQIFDNRALASFQQDSNKNSQLSRNGVLLELGGV